MWDAGDGVRWKSDVMTNVKKVGVATAEYVPVT